MDIDVAREIIPGLTIAIGGTGPAIGIGLIGAAALQAIGRNPEVAGKLQSTLIILLAFAEAIAIYSLVWAFLLRFL
jgi:F-type H+-transporting ATPase subunit c